MKTETITKTVKINGDEIAIFSASNGYWFAPTTERRFGTATLAMRNEIAANAHLWDADVDIDAAVAGL